MLTTSKAYSGFTVDDLDRAATFYTDKLGLEIREHDAEMGLMALHLAGDTDVFVYAKADHAPATFTVLNFPVANVPTAVRELGERGVQFERYDGFDQDEHGIHRGGGPLIAWFTDPAGNVMSVIQD